MANTLKFGNGEWYGKKDTILAYNDLNSNYKPLPFNFSRASKATVINKDGLIETVGNGQPRIDYADDSKGALLLEPSRSNITYPSENFSNQLQGAYSTFGTVISPDGTLNGSTIESSVDGAYKGWHKTYSLTDNTYTFSMFVKYYNSQWISIYKIGQAISRFDVKNGVFGNNPSNLKSVDYGNGWYRLEFTFNASVGTNYLYIYPSSDSGETSSLGDGLHIYGAQLEQSSYATSYIPTQGSIVTRLADVCNQTPPSGIINSSEGVLYLDLKTSENDTVQQIALTDGTIDERILLEIRNGGTLLTYYVIQGGVAEAIIAIPISAGVYNKVALSYKTNEAKIYVNGVLEGTDLVVTPPTGLDTISFNGSTGSLNVYISLKDLRVYNQVLTDAELQALTTL